MKSEPETLVWLILKSRPLHESTLLSKGVRDLFQQGPSIQMCSTLESVPDKYHQTLKMQVTSLSLLWPPHRILPLVPNVSLLLQESYPKLWLSPLALDWKGSWQGREWLQQRGPLSSNMNANCHLFQWSKYSREIKKKINKKKTLLGKCLKSFDQKVKDRDFLGFFHQQAWLCPHDQS